LKPSTRESITFLITIDDILDVDVHDLVVGVTFPTTDIHSPLVQMSEIVIVTSLDA